MQEVAIAIVPATRVADGTEHYPVDITFRFIGTGSAAISAAAVTNGNGYT